MLRNNCVVCDGYKFIDIYRNTQYPIVFTPPSLDKNVEDDEYEDLHFIGCVHCGCIQTKILIDQAKLYKDAYNITYNYPTMQRRYDGFTDFIIKNIINDNIIEIGGSNGALVKIVQEKKIFNYSIMYLYDSAPDVPNVKFINANCETYDFPENNTIILSHVFEHLYNPLKFVENLKRNNVNQIIISNLDFDNLLQRNDISIINFERTYYCNTCHLDHIMKQYGYSRKDSLEFEKQAVFYNYLKDSSETVYDYNDVIKNVYLLDKLLKYFIGREKKIRRIKIDNNYQTFICTAGHYGQMAYNFLDKYVKENVVGFLDGDPLKIGKRVYGTEYFTYAKSKLSEYVNVNVILCVERYRDEITSELLSHNKNTNIINI